MDECSCFCTKNRCRSDRPKSAAWENEHQQLDLKLFRELMCCRFPDALGPTLFDFSLISLASTQQLDECSCFCPTNRHRRDRPKSAAWENERQQLVYIYIYIYMSPVPADPPPMVSPTPPKPSICMLFAICTYTYTYTHIYSPFHPSNLASLRYLQHLRATTSSTDLVYLYISIITFFSNRL